LALEEGSALPEESKSSLKKEGSASPEEEKSL
jgi:hypothetical protein